MEEQTEQIPEESGQEQAQTSTIPTAIITSQDIISKVWMDYVAPNGWYVLVLLIVSWWLYHKIVPILHERKKVQSFQKSQNPARREVLDTDLRAIREQQQLYANVKAIEEEELKKKKKDERIENSAKISTQKFEKKNFKNNDGYNALTGSSLPQYRLTNFR